MRAAIHREWANAMIAGLCRALQLTEWNYNGTSCSVHQTTVEYMDQCRSSVGGTSVCVRPPPEQCRAAGELQGAQLNPYQGFTSSKGALGFEAFPGRALGAQGRRGRRGTRFCAQVSILCLGQSWGPPRE